MSISLPDPPSELPEELRNYLDELVRKIEKELSLLSQPQGSGFVYTNVPTTTTNKTIDANAATLDELRKHVAHLGTALKNSQRSIIS